MAKAVAAVQQEVTRHVLRQRGESAALRVAAVMQQGQVAELDAALALRAAQLSIEFSLPMADSIMLATARAHDATIWTQDADLKGLACVEYVAAQ